MCDKNLALYLQQEAIFFREIELFLYFMSFFALPAYSYTGEKSHEIQFHEIFYLCFCLLNNIKYFHISTFLLAPLTCSALNFEIFINTIFQKKNIHPTSNSFSKSAHFFFFQEDLWWVKAFY